MREKEMERESGRKFRLRFQVTNKKKKKYELLFHAFTAFTFFSCQVARVSLFILPSVTAHLSLSSLLMLLLMVMAMVMASPKHQSGRQRSEVKSNLLECERGEGVPREFLQGFSQSLH